METGVGEVVVGKSGDVFLDINALAGYTWQGKCSRVTFHRATLTRYREDLRIWNRKCGKRKWTLDITMTYTAMIKKKSKE